MKALILAPGTAEIAGIEGPPESFNLDFLLQLLGGSLQRFEVNWNGFACDMLVNDDGPRSGIFAQLNSEASEIAGRLVFGRAVLMHKGDFKLT